MKPSLFYLCITTFLLSLPLVGCGDNYPDTVSVTGRLTYGGGDWPAPGSITFNCLEPADGYTRRSGTADFSEDGKFRVESWEGVYGLMPGKYRVSLTCWKHPPSMDPKAPAAVSYIEKKYRNSANSDWEITIEPNGDAVFIEKDIPKFEG